MATPRGRSSSHGAGPAANATNAASRRTPPLSINAEQLEIQIAPAYEFSLALPGPSGSWRPEAGQGEDRRRARQAQPGQAAGQPRGILRSSSHDDTSFAARDQGDLERRSANQETAAESDTSDSGPSPRNRNHPADGAPRRPSGSARAAESRLASPPTSPGGRESDGGATSGYDDDDDDYDEDEETCFVCFELRRYLKKLPCGHSLCEACLQRIINVHADQNFPCPLCRSPTPVPTRGASDFPIHGSARAQTLRMDEVVAGLKVSSFFKNRGKERCRNCGEQESKFLCLQCQTAICDWCRYDYHRGPDHPLVLIPGTELTDSACASHEGQYSDARCRTHMFQDLRFFCWGCAELVCEVCWRHNHLDHDVQRLGEAVTKARAELRETRVNVERCLRRLQVAQDCINTQRRQLQQDVVRNQYSIRSRAAEARALVDVHERAALRQLKDVSSTLDRQLTTVFNRVKDKTAGVTVILRHMTRVMTSSHDADLVRMHVSASETIGADNYLSKFTTDLPTTVCTVDLKQENFSDLAPILDIVIGSPRVVTSLLHYPQVKVLNDYSFVSNSYGQIEILSVCPVAQKMAWMVFRQDIGMLGETTIGYCNMETCRVSRTENVLGSVALARVDDHLVFAKLENYQKILRVEGKNETLKRTKKYDFIHFNKGALRACLRIAKSWPQKKASGLQEIVVNVRSITHILQYSGILGKKAFTVHVDGNPVNMDISGDGKLVAVVNDAHNVYFFSRGSPFPRMVLSPADNAKHMQEVVDVCFYTLGGREVLLVADRTQEDVLVLSVVKNRCSLLTFLTNMSGQLNHPSAFNVDPTNGNLLVVCAGKSIVVCGDTGVNNDCSPKEPLAELKTTTMS